MAHLTRILLSVVGVVTAVLAVVIAVPGPAAASPVPSTPAGLPSAIEPLAPYVGQISCSPVTKHGTALLAALLRATYVGTTTGTVRACDSSTSEHHDGRAIDWMVSARDAAQRADAKSFIAWLLASDASGNRFAMARRLGVMYVIWNNRMWGAWSGSWEEYNGCLTRTTRADDNACHRTHVHISLSWNGATGRTTYWTKQVAATDFGPCRPVDLNWANYRGAVNTQPCPRYPVVRALPGASALKVALVKYSGTSVRYGWLGGPAVSAVQQALHVTASGLFDLLTRVRVITFQTLHGLSTTGVVNAATWRALLAMTR
jgi:hypothetical protein